MGFLFSSSVIHTCSLPSELTIHDQLNGMFDFSTSSFTQQSDNTYSCYSYNIITKHSICFKFFGCSTFFNERCSRRPFSQMQKFNFEFHNIQMTFQNSRWFSTNPQSITSVMHPFSSKCVLKRKIRENKIKSVRCFRLHSQNMFDILIISGVGWGTCWLQYLFTGINSILESRKEWWNPFHKCRKKIFHLNNLVVVLVNLERFCSLSSSTSLSNFPIALSVFYKLNNNIASKISFNVFTWNWKLQIR